MKSVRLPFAMVMAAAALRAASPWMYVPVVLFFLAVTLVVVRRTMEKSECHRNLAEIWSDKQHELIGIGTGYSLSDDGLWRQHSWGLRREGILETTVSRAKYFGILLQHGDADSFAMANLAGASMSCGSVKRKTEGS